jgi:hypothetical protein
MDDKGQPLAAHLASRVQRAVLLAERRLLGDVTGRIHDPRHLLRDFPVGRDVVVVVGDRREDRLRLTRADLLAFSLSASDLRFLLHLGLDPSVEIISDKVLTLMSDGYLGPRFGHKDLLIIGSPAVNLAARRLSLHAPFRFDISPEAQVVEEKLRHLWDLNEPKYIKAAGRLLNDPRLLSGSTIPPNPFKGVDDPDLASLSEDQVLMLARSLKEVITPVLGHLRREAGPRTVAHLIDLYREPAIVDPVDGKVHHGTREDETTDIGLLSVGPNPWSTAEVPRLCVFVAGVRGPATAQALRKLGEHDEKWFERRPLGGVMRVKLDPHKDWPSRFDQAHSEWVTSPYDPADLVTKIDAVLSKPSHALHGKVSMECRSFIERLRLGDAAAAEEP